jgi:hypothetical protein
MAESIWPTAFVRGGGVSPTDRRSDSLRRPAGASMGACWWDPFALVCCDSVRKASQTGVLPRPSHVQDGLLPAPSSDTEAKFQYLPVRGPWLARGHLTFRLNAETPQV